MNYLQFDKTQLINLEYSLKKELVRTNRAGTFSSTTIINCHTRKYHGLLIVPIENLDDENHVLLSALDETIIQHDKEFHLAVRRYQPGIYHSGHKYIREFYLDPIPKLIYRVGGVVLQKETLLAEENEQVLIRYTLLDAHSPTKLKLHPFLVFRQIHKLTHANMDVNTKSTIVDHGVKVRMYEPYPDLHMQISKKAEWVIAPDWFYNTEYTKEKERGYDYIEDLFNPGYFEVDLKKGESIVFSGSTNEIAASALSRVFDNEIKKRIPRDSFEHCLTNAAQQFISRRNGKTEIIAGFPWFGKWGRDTFISLPGLTLGIDDPKTCKAVLDTESKELKGGLFRNRGNHEHTDNNSADASLWYIWAIQQYAETANNDTKIWKDYGKNILQILNAYRFGTEANIKMHDNGLIYASLHDTPLTWMDAKINGVPVTHRPGYNVEINGLWYNAVCFMLEIAAKAKDLTVLENWKDLPNLISKSFVEIFWDSKQNYLADYFDGTFKDWSVRPNQILAAAMKYTPLDEDKLKAVVDVVQSELVTPRGLRSLTPKNPAYQGTCLGNSAQRDSAYHQGTSWPWLLSFFAEAYLRIYEQSGAYFISKLYRGFEEEMGEHGIGTISEIYDGNPPHDARGAISQAWSVAALLKTKKLLLKYES